MGWKDESVAVSAAGVDETPGDVVSRPLPHTRRHVRALPTALQSTMAFEPPQSHLGCLIRDEEPEPKGHVDRRTVRPINAKTGCLGVQDL